MAREEIIEKLNKFMEDHDPITEECQVVYIMVQIRKVLDHDKDHKKNGLFTLLRFYCDWTLHTEKTIITDNMKVIMDEVYEDIKIRIENPVMVKAISPLMQFAYMESLRSQFKNFLQERSLNLTLVNDGWIPFIQCLVKILENQPINNPNNKISLFSFIPAADRCVRGVIKFNNPINGFGQYDFGNAY